jgi:hypothetical protein
MNLVIEHGDKQIIALVDCDELDTDTIPNIKKIFFCESIDEVLIVIEELRNERA